MAEGTRRRLGELQRAVFSVLLDEPDGLQVQEVLKHAEAACPATPFENQDYPSRPGVRRYPNTVRYATITAVKAGWLVKDKGQWRLTDDGRAAYAQHADPEAFEKAAIRGYQAWRAENQPPVAYDASEAEADAEAEALERAGTRTRRAWLVRGANVHGVNVLPLWFAEGFCSITSPIPDLPQGTSKLDIANHVLEAYADEHIVTRGLYVGIFHRFLNEMAIDDLVVTVDGSKVYVGTIVGGPEYVAAHSTDRRRAVDWANARSPFTRSELTSDAADGLRGQLAISDLTQFLPEFARLGGIELDVVDATVSVGEIDVSLPAPSDALAKELLLAGDWLRETIDLLNDKRQIVLYGPPGTGKTYLAQELCKALVEPAGEKVRRRAVPSFVCVRGLL
jgi:hypothetical protein